MQKVENESQMWYNQKYTSHLTGYCVKNRIGTIVLGDLKGIRNGAKHGKVANQKVHQWMFKKGSKKNRAKSPVCWYKSCVC